MIHKLTNMDVMFFLHLYIFFGQSTVCMFLEQQKFWNYFKYFQYFWESYCIILKQVLWHRDLLFLDEKRQNPHRMGKMTWVMSPICGSPIILFICWSRLSLKQVRFSAFSDSLSQSHWSGGFKSFSDFSHNHSQLMRICSWVGSVIYFKYTSFQSLYLW